MKNKKITLNTDIKKQLKPKAEIQMDEILKQGEKAFQYIKSIEKDHPEEAEKLYKRLLDASLKLMRHNLGLEEQQPLLTET